MNRLRPLRIRLLILLLCGLVTSPALGINQVNGTGEPAFTNSASNTWYFKLTANVAQGDAYRITVRTYAGTNNIQNQVVNLGPGNYNGFPYSDVQSGLTEGVTYQDCASGENFFSYLGAFTPDSIGSCFGLGTGTWTTIDRTKPAIQVFVNGTDSYAKSLAMRYRINYQDGLAPPFPANFVCRSFGTPGACPSFDYQANCSVPIAGNNRINAFECTETLPAGAPDGPVYFCARSADQAVPDIPNNPDQFTGATADKANLSDVGCGNVILDRTAPTLAATANGASGSVKVKVGDLVTFAGQASDATSGVPHPLTWSFGDNTSGASGASVAHTYTQAGTYQASVATTDGAGNSGSAKVTMTVSPPDTGGASGSTGAGTVVPPPTPAQISGQTGGGGTQATTVSKLGAVTPKTVRITKRLAALPLALTAGGRGKVTITLRRAGKVIAKGGTVFTRAGKAGFRLRLPRRLQPGGYRLTIAFTPKGGRTITRTVKVSFVGAARLKGRTTMPRVLTGAPSLTPPAR